MYLKCFIFISIFLATFLKALHPVQAVLYLAFNDNSAADAVPSVNTNARRKELMQWQM